LKLKEFRQNMEGLKKEIPSLLDYFNMGIIYDCINDLKDEESKKILKKALEEALKKREW